jgi:pimeloyl-ACP methyl ester carboxylesterase
VSESELSKKHELLLRHPNGRTVHCSIIGARDLKKVVFYSHGFPASRIEAVTAHQQALKLGLTIVALDRPGFGASEWYEGRRFEDWSEDVRLVADHLEVARFAVLGVSGGTPTAVAAAAAMPERVSSLVVVSGVGPVDGPQALAGMNIANRVLLRLAQSAPWLAQGFVWSLAHVWRTFPGAVALWFGMLLPAVDRRIVERREVGIVLAKNIKEALSQGARGTVSEFMLLASDWSALLARVAVPTSIWHGDADTYVPISMGESLHQGIKGSSFHKVVGGGHFMILDTMDQVLEGIA